jgi:tetratricopeptide (TPR) repeat protein
MPDVTVSSLDPRVQKQVENAQTALQRGNLDYVIEVAGQVLKAAPGCLPVRRLLRTAQLRHAQTKGKLGTKLFGSVTQASFMFGSSKDPQKALENADKLLAADPNSLPALKLLAEASATLGFPETAAWAWQCAHELQPNDRNLLLSYGEASLVAKKPKDALRAADLILKLMPQDGDALALMRKASIAETAEKGKWDEQGSFRDKLKDEALAVSLEQAAKVVTSDEMTERLIKEAKDRHAQQPDNLDHIRSIVEGYRKLNNLPEAIVWIRKARALPTGRGDTVLEKLETEMQIAQLEKEVKEFETALAATPADSALEARLDAAKTGLANFRLADAKGYVERYPNDYDARYTLANLYFGLKDYQNAIANFQQAKKSPKSRVQALAGMGKALKARKMFDLAVGEFQNAKSEIQTMDETKKDVIYELADCYEKMGKKEDAINEYKVIYGEDIGYRDVSDKINAFYSSQ